MSKTHISKIILVVCCMIVMLMAFSCLKYLSENLLAPPKGALDNETLLLLLRSGISFSDFQGKDLNQDQAKEILRTMIPIEATMTDEKMLSDADIEYRFMVQASRNPLVFGIKIDGEKLIFQEHFSVNRGETYLYKGGNSLDFIETIQRLGLYPEVVPPTENTESNAQCDEN